MDELSPSDLKTILHSKRAQIYFLEHCRVLLKGGRVEYVTEAGKRSLYWNIPIANTISIMLGSGTSITQAAMRELAKAGVLVGFCGGGGTPLFSAQERELDIAWMSPQSEYRPTEYLQSWVGFWFDDQLRLKAAKEIQKTRLDFLKRSWSKENRTGSIRFPVSLKKLERLIEDSVQRITTADGVVTLLTEEARLTKALFKLAVDAVGYGSFIRSKNGRGLDPANRFLDHGNYLAYGLGATATWVLGLPHGLAVLHGKTRRGGLVFDAADIVKDAIILPRAFLSAMQGHDEQQFRQACIEDLIHSDALDFIIDTLKRIALTTGGESS